MRFYQVLDRAFPTSYAAKFGAVIAFAVMAPAVAALLVPATDKAGRLLLVSVAIAAALGALRAVAALLQPLRRVSAALHRTEAGIPARSLPDRHRDDLGQLMQCTNRLSAGMDARLATVAEAAERDTLTGLLNRRGLERRMPTLRPGAILIVDLDHFKAINDAHGHLVGDRILAQVAGILSTTFRRGDLLARIGGEEFLACLPDATMDQAALTAERVRMALEDRRIIDGRAVTASIGVACGRRGVPGWQVIQAADEAMFEAKIAGRNRVVCAGTTAVPEGPQGKTGGLLPEPRTDQNGLSGEAPSPDGRRAV